MKLFVVAVCACLALVAAAVPQKRFGVPLSAEDDCNPNIRARNFSADPNDCQVFYICDNGWPKISFCPGVTVWTPAAERCLNRHEAENAVCQFVYVPEAVEIGVGLAPVDETCDFQCEDNSGCIARRAQCDGISHCRDGSDERDCAPPCDLDRCRLPDCKCSDTLIPGGLLASQVPQLVMIGWDEAVRVEDYNHLYQQIFKKLSSARRREPRRNADGCPMTGTFFVSHQFTDYAAVNALYAEGNEIATHSVSKQLPAEYWRDSERRVWHEEFVTMRLLLNQLGNVKAEDIVGMRAPYLQTAGDDTIIMAQRNNFLYDSSYATDRNDYPIWPYTFDYRSTAGCAVEPCPLQSLPGVWEIPLVDWIDTNNTLCENVDSCYFPETKQEAMELLFSNFARHYQTNKAPFAINLRARWFLDDGMHNLEALQDFLEGVERMDDVYVVTFAQALQWVRDPTPLNDMDGFFNCDYRDRTPMCEHPTLCGYYNITYQPNDVDHQGDRFFMTCNECPPQYPWVMPIDTLRALGL
ncbi:PREDICTED: uncharacterized protein LOC106816133 [Priapulus caudatus]|uniref:Uncharacterized protein LOC106816133 n=1 Tax=Priapulus caudatus TaxID=37621 RepID=A0ABM1EVG1_PRICU|nr:PREDICTED: uncharacterized protein LOC106816133 [Priapulus caudatus]